MVSVEEATNDLLHTLGNFLGIVGEVVRNYGDTKPRFMDEAELGRYAMDKEPELRAALDKLKHARNVERIEAEYDGTDKI